MPSAWAGYDAQARDGAVAATPGNLIGRTCYEGPLSTLQMGLRLAQYAHPDFSAVDPASRFMREFFQRQQGRLNALAQRQLKEEDERLEGLKRPATRHAGDGPGGGPPAVTADPPDSSGAALIRVAQVLGYNAAAARKAYVNFPGAENGVTACLPFRCHGGCTFGIKCRFVHPPSSRAELTSAEFAKLGPVTAAICAVSGGHLSGRRIEPGDRIAASEKAWAKAAASTRSGREKPRPRAPTPLSRNPVPTLLSEVVSANPHALQDKLEDLIRDDAPDHFRPLPKALNPAPERFDPTSVKPHEIVGGDTEQFQKDYKAFVSAFEMVEQVFKRLGVWNPPPGSVDDDNDYVEDRDRRVQPWLASYIELNTKDARLGSDAEWDVAVVDALWFAVAGDRNTPGISSFANLALRRLNGTRAGGPTDFLGTLLLNVGPSEPSSDGNLPRAAVNFLCGVVGYAVETGDTIRRATGESASNKCAICALSISSLVAVGSRVSEVHATDAATAMDATLRVTAQAFARSPINPKVPCGEAPGDALVVPNSIIESFVADGLTSGQAECVEAVSDALGKDRDNDLGTVALMSLVPAISVASGGGGEWSTRSRLHVKYIIMFRTGVGDTPAIFVITMPLFDPASPESWVAYILISEAHCRPVHFTNYQSVPASYEFLRRAVRQGLVVTYRKGECWKTAIRRAAVGEPRFRWGSFVGPSQRFCVRPQGLSRRHGRRSPLREAEPDVELDVSDDDSLPDLEIVGSGEPEGPEDPATNPPRLLNLLAFYGSDSEDMPGLTQASDSESEDEDFPGRGRAAKQQFGKLRRAAKRALAAEEVDRILRRAPVDSLAATQAAADKPELATARERPAPIQANRESPAQADRKNLSSGTTRSGATGGDVSSKADPSSPVPSGSSVSKSLQEMSTVDQARKVALATKSAEFSRGIADPGPMQGAECSSTRSGGMPTPLGMYVPQVMQDWLKDNEEVSVVGDVKVAEDVKVEPKAEDKYFKLKTPTNTSGLSDEAKRYEGFTNEQTLNAPTPAVCRALAVRIVDAFEREFVDEDELGADSKGGAWARGVCAAHEGDHRPL